MHLNCPHCRNPIEVVELPEGEVLCPSCGSSFHLTNANTTVEFKSAEHGQMFGRFAVQQQVGMGAFGTVYKAVDGDLHRTVALKVPRASNIAPSKAGIDRFLREARSAAQLRHPSIVTVHEVGVQNDQPYLVSDFVDGVTLADWLTAHEATFRQAAQWIAELAEALHYAHTQGVIHRDVKPSNIMLASSTQSSVCSAQNNSKPEHSAPSNEHLYLMDFGLAKRDAGEITMTMEGQVLGTPAYMSPEQARGEGHAVDGRADEYSLGVIFYELLTGELPFRGNTRMLMEQVMHEEAKSPRKINDRIPLDLETICLKAMAKEPGRRYASCAELAADLRRYLKGEPIFARPVGRLERGWRWCKRNPAVAGLMAGIAAVLLAATVLSSGLAFWAIDEKGRGDENAQKAADSALAAGKNAEEAKLRAGEALEEKNRVQRLLAIQANREGFRLIDEHDFYTGLLWFTQSLALTADIPEFENITRVRLNAYRSFEMHRLLITCLIKHEERIANVSFSPNGILFATASFDKTARVWYVNNSKPVTPPLKHEASVTQIAFSPDSRRVATVSLDNTTRLWDATTGKLLIPPLRHNGSVLHTSFSFDGNYIVTASEDKTARVWDANTGQTIAIPLKHEASVARAVFSPDGRRVVTASHDKTVRIWNTTTGQLIIPPIRHEAPVLAASFSPNGHLVLTASEDKTARVWNAITGQPLIAIMHDGVVGHASFSPNGQCIVTASDDKTARVWDAFTGQPITPPLKHDERVMNAAFSQDGRYIITASFDKTARVWEANTGKPIIPPLIHVENVSFAEFSPDCRFIATASWDKTARIWSLVASKYAIPAMQHDGIVWNATFSPDGKFVVTASSDRTSRVWDIVSGRCLYLPLQHDSSVSHAAFSPDGLKVVTASWDKTARVWNALTGQPVSPAMKHDERLLFATFSPDSRRVATASYDRSAQVWDVANGQVVTPPMVHNGHVSHVEFSPDGRQILTASYDGSAQVWDAETGRPIFSPMHHDDSIIHNAYSSNGRLVVTASSDKTARLWDAVTGQLVAPPLKHEASVVYVSFSPDCRRVVTASFDKTARVWDTKTGQPITPQMKHASGIGHAVFSQDGRYVVTASSDKSARVWDADTGQPVTPSLVHSGLVSHAMISSDGLNVVSASHDKTARLWPLSADTRSKTDLLKLAQVYASHKIDETGSLQPLDVEKELLPWYKELKDKYPDEFIPKYEDTRRWRLKQIEDCCKERNLPAALFHQNWLLAEAVQQAASRK